MQSTADEIGYRVETGHKFDTSLHTIIHLQVILLKFFVADLLIQVCHFYTFQLPSHFHYRNLVSSRGIIRYGND